MSIALFSCLFLLLASKTKVNHALSEVQLSQKIDALVESLDRLSLVISNKVDHETRLEKLEHEIETIKHQSIKDKVEAKDKEMVYFSVSTSQKIECYSCMVTFDVIHTMSPQSNLLVENAIFLAPSRGIYLFQFHALTEPGNPVKVQLVVNDKPRAFIYDRDVSGANNRFAMVSQSLMIAMEKGDEFHVLLHEGALKGGGVSHTFTSLNGHKIGSWKLPSNNAIL